MCFKATLIILGPRLCGFITILIRRPVQWMRDRSLLSKVDCFVFVSEWQRLRFVAEFGLNPEKTKVLRNATEMEVSYRTWDRAPRRRFAYTSTPFRGLGISS